jgi:limonene-1,2-epoxide hydrolase
MRDRGSNESLVREFFAAMGPTLEDFKSNYRDRMTEDAIWESVGLPPRRGRDACVAYLDDLHRRTGMEYCTIEELHLASHGDVVLTERIDTMCRPDGSEIVSFRIMGAIEVRDGRIARYTDYFDTASTGKSPSAPQHGGGVSGSIETTVPPARTPSPPEVDEHVAPPLKSDSAAAWTQWIDSLPATQAMGLRCQSVDQGRLMMTMEKSVWPLNPNGALHGGLVVAAADHVMGVAATTMLDAGRVTATASLTTEFHLPAFPPVTFEAQVVRNGRTLAFVDLSCFEADGRRCGAATGVWSISDKTTREG